MNRFPRQSIFAMRSHGKPPTRARSARALARLAFAIAFALPHDGMSITVAAGDSHACATTSAGAVQCWGWNDHGQLGDGSFDGHLLPANVDGIAVGASTVVAGDNHTCASGANGVVLCWGLNNYGQLGDGTTFVRPSPVQVSGFETGGAMVVAPGGFHTCSLNTAFGVQCWGWNGNGQLGDGSGVDHHTPAAVTGLAGDATAITAGNLHACALASGGGLACWGRNGSGQLGDGTISDRFLPTAVVGFAAGASGVEAGAYHTCAITSAGGVQCWGANDRGQLGDGTRVDRLVPTPVPGLAAPVLALAAGFGHTCALSSAGGVYCWGDNGFGQLGDGTWTDRLTPVGVHGLDAGVVSITAGSFFTCALLAGERIRCWGSNFRGQLGDGTMQDRPTPVDVVGFGESIFTNGFEA